MIPERAAAVVIRSDRRVAGSAFTAFYVKEAHENSIDDAVDDQPDVINSLYPFTDGILFGNTKKRFKFQVAPHPTRAKNWEVLTQILL